MTTSTGTSHAEPRPERVAANAEPVLLSVNIGMPKDVDWQGRTVHTGAWKYPVQGAHLVRRLNIEGDGQGDLAGHGGEIRAVLVYQLASYQHWREHFGRNDLTYGNFGENLTVDGLPDDEVAIGDRYRIGDAEFEVTQPRVTCYRVGMRLGEPEIASLLVGHHRPGFYMRVITEGQIQAGDKIVKTKTGPGKLSVADTDALLYLPDHDPAKLRVAVQIPALSPGWQQSFQDLLAKTDSPSAGQTNQPAEPAWSGFRPLVVTAVTHETSAVTSITFSAPDGTRLPAAGAGQYLTLRLAAAGDPAPIRNYSLSGARDVGFYRISVKREPNGVASIYLNQDVRPGDTIDVAAPRGEFTLAPGTGPVVLLSAGIGVTPVLCMLHQLVTEKSQRDVWWIRTARQLQDDALAAEAQSLLRLLSHGHERVFYTDGVLEDGQGKEVASGRLTGARLAQLGLPGTGATAYVCGPTSFMDDMRDALGSIGFAAGDIRYERFGSRGSINPGIAAAASRPPHQPAGTPATGPLVTFARTGLSVHFGANGRTLLELAEACDVPTRWSCRAGVCHICITPLLSGDINYVQAPLELPGPQDVLVCSAEPKTDVVLDM
jgi:ferredoxin-NADP reductase/MOSC domain-containing protein YiiM